MGHQTKKTSGNEMDRETGSFKVCIDVGYDYMFETYGVVKLSLDTQL